MAFWLGLLSVVQKIKGGGGIIDTLLGENKYPHRNTHAIKMHEPWMDIAEFPQYFFLFEQHFASHPIPFHQHKYDKSSKD